LDGVDAGGDSDDGFQIGADLAHVGNLEEAMIRLVMMASVGRPIAK
jgi:hypothetical protein